MNIAAVKERIMNSNIEAARIESTQVMLSTLWIFLMFNYLYCDVLGVMDSTMLKQFLTGRLDDGLELTQGFLLGSSILMEIPILMVLLSRVLDYRWNRWANIIAGALMAAVQAGSLFIGPPTSYYIFFSAIEIAMAAYVVWYAWQWRK
jgi:MFS family permease